MLYGRKKIYTDELVITKENLVGVLRNAYNVHLSNRADIEKLYDYYRGKQAIENKTKEIRENINNKVCVNHANEIVSFYLGFTLGEPIQYIRRNENTKDISAINDLMLDCNKSSQDRDLAEWLFICGVGYRLVVPDKVEDGKISIYTLDPRNTFVVYANDITEKPLLGVTYVQGVNTSELTYYVYTDNKQYVVKGDKVVEENPHIVKYEPIVEYTNNNARLGSFETVVGLLDAINTIESNRIDDIEQFVNSFLAIMGATLDEETFENIKLYKMLGLPEGTDAKYLSSALAQADTQVLIDNLYREVLRITGVPNTSESKGGTSDNGVAVYLRNGFQSAETRALAFEQSWKKSEKQFLKIALSILNRTTQLDIKVSDLEIKFARRYTDNIQTKAQVLTQLLDCGVAPDIAFTTCGIWNDAYSVYEASKEYLKKWELDDVQEVGLAINEIVEE